MGAVSPAERMLLSGDDAVAWGATLARAQLIPVYPITPQTPILEKISALSAQGICRADVVTVESEHSAMSVALAGCLGGVRVFTASASQGIFYMHEVLHFTAMARAPVVMVGVNRSHSLPWAFWADHSDTLSQRDTGWVQLYCETAQEALDMVPIAHRIAEELFIPVMPVFEAVYVSHTYEPVTLPAQAAVDQFLPPYPDQFRMRTEDPRGYGNCVTAQQWLEHRRKLQEAHEQVPDVAGRAFADWAGLTGRRYDLLEPYRCEDADLVLLTIGGPAGTAREAVDRLRDAGLRVGLLKQRLVRPAPVALLRQHLVGVPKVAVIDRNLSPGAGGTIAQEVRAALQGVAGAPPVHSFIAGIGGSNIGVADMEQMARLALAAAEPSPYGVWHEGGRQA